jgi:hypothetical protein
MFLNNPSASAGLRCARQALDARFDAEGALRFWPARLKSAAGKSRTHRRWAREFFGARSERRDGEKSQDFNKILMKKYLLRK